jgi:hypothetical protein
VIKDGEMMHRLFSESENAAFAIAGDIHCAISGLIRAIERVVSTQLWIGSWPSAWHSQMPHCSDTSEVRLICYAQKSGAFASGNS